MKFPCTEKRFTRPLLELLVPNAQVLLPGFEVDDVIGANCYWLEAKGEVPPHLDGKTKEYAKVLVYSQGSSAVLSIQPIAGDLKEKDWGEWVEVNITTNSLYILRGDENMHKLVLPEGARSVFVVFFKAERWPQPVANAPQVLVEHSPQQALVVPATHQPPKVKCEGGGIRSIEVGPGWVYLIRSKVNIEGWVHKTGPSLFSGEANRLVAVIGGRFPGDDTVSEKELLSKKSWLSLLYHYRYQVQAAARKQVAGVLEHIQVNEDEESLIDTECDGVPEIPHGRVCEEHIRRLREATMGMRQSSARVLFSDHGSGMGAESVQNNANVTEAYENLIHSPRLFGSSSNLKVYDDELLGKSGQPVRGGWNDIVRAMLHDINVEGAEGFQVLSVRLVDEAAVKYHIDQLGFGPSVVVAVLSGDWYRVLFAHAKAGPTHTIIQTH
jgi:hypothetical protein